MPAARAAVAAAALCALVALAAPQTSRADTVKARSVLPPGQSGFVSITGLPDGTGSPHLTDQVDLFTSFDYKPFGFDLPGDVENPAPGVEISRDAYGVPAISGESEYKAWWGVGYAVAQDRLFQLELFKRATSGRLAEILGSTFLDDDLIARRDYYTDAEVDRMLADIPERLQRRTEAYRDGVNAWIDHVRTHPEDMPGEFVALGVPLEDWSLRDSTRVGIFLACTVPSGDGNELPNARALKGIGPRNFDTIHPVRTPGRRITVPRSEGEFPAQPGRTRRDERIGFRRSREFLETVRLRSATDTAELVPGQEEGAAAPAPVEPRSVSDSEEAPATIGEAAASGGPGAGLRSILPSPGGSFMWTIGDPAGDRSYLFNGPQLGFSIPELFVEFELHSPSQPRLRGVTAAGVPLVGIGHNGRVAWGFTSGLSDEDDMYVESLAGPESYRFNGRERQMRCRDETFTWKPPPTGVGDLVSDPGLPAGATTERICRTVHGPVQQLGDGFALSRRYAVWGRELETIVGLDALNRADGIGDVDDAMQQVTWNENVIAGDDRGNIGYWHPGLHQLRPKRWDERLPYPGTGEAEWRGLLPRPRTPHVINPEQGWVANWNNPPSAGWTNGDGPARERLAGPFHRVRLLERLVARVADDPSFQRSTRIVLSSGTTAQQRPFVSERRLLRAQALAGSQGAGALRVLRAWDGDYDSTNGEGTVAPGVAVWEAFKHQVRRILVGPMGRSARVLAGKTSLSHQFDITNGEAAGLRLLGARDYARAADRAARRLARRFSSADPADWRQDRRMYEVSAMGAGSAPDLPFFDRGTWEQSVTMGRP